MPAGNPTLDAVKDVEVSVAMAGAPDWARFLAERTERRLQEMNDALVGHANVAAAAHDELLGMIGRPLDKFGLNGSGLAGEVSLLRHTIGKEPDSDGRGGYGVLGRLATHDKRGAKVDRWVRDARILAAAAAFTFAILAFILQDQFRHLFAVPVH